jgi:hypothetical protein
MHPDDPPTIQTDKVIVRLFARDLAICPSVVAGKVTPFYQAYLLELVKRAVDGRQAQVRILLPSTRVDGLGIQTLPGFLQADIHRAIFDLGFQAGLEQGRQEVSLQIT